MDIAAEIRSVLADRENRSEDQVAALASQYAAYCVQINDKFNRCADLLRRGLRSEAVHLAECHPNLFSAGRALDLRDRRRWKKLCLARGLASPPRLRTESIELLEKARQVEQSLQPLLTQHRMLAVGRGPIRDRLAVLRGLARQDPENSGWSSDLRMLEPERVSEIRHAIKKKSNDLELADLHSLLDECSADGWINPVPTDLKSRISKRLRNATRAATEKECGALASQLVTAQEQGDTRLCASLIEKWHSMSGQESALSEQTRDAMLPKIEAVTQWLTERRRAEIEESEQKSALRNRAKAILARRQLLRRLAIVILVGCIIAAVEFWRAGFLHRH